MLSSATQIAPSSETDLRQLRHHTKNALQRILCQIEQCRGLQDTPAGRHLVHDLERRVRLSSAVSDALFGLTSTPGPLRSRLQQLCDTLIELQAAMADYRAALCRDRSQLLPLRSTEARGNRSSWSTSVMKTSPRDVARPLVSAMMGIGRVRDRSRQWRRRPPTQITPRAGAV